MGAVSVVECRAKFGLIIERQSSGVIYFLEEMSSWIEVARNLFLFAVKSMFVKFTTLEVVNVLECCVFVHISEQFSLFVSDVLNV